MSSDTTTCDVTWPSTVRTLTDNTTRQHRCKRHGRHIVCICRYCGTRRHPTTIGDTRG